MPRPGLTDNQRESVSYARRARADDLAFKFVDVTTTDSYATVTLTQLSTFTGEIATGETVDSTDPAYALDSAGEVITANGMIWVAFDAAETGGVNAVDVKIQRRNLDGVWIDLAESVGLAASASVEVYDDTSGHAQYRVQIKANVGGSQGDVSGYIHIS